MNCECCGESIAILQSFFDKMLCGDCARVYTSGLAERGNWHLVFKLSRVLKDDRRNSSERTSDDRR